MSKYGEDQLCAIALTKTKTNFEGFTQNGCYGNQPHPFEVLALTPTDPAMWLLQNKI